MLQSGYAETHSHFIVQYKKLCQQELEKADVLISLVLSASAENIIISKAFCVLDIETAARVLQYEYLIRA